MESLELLKKRRCPFIIAMNKIDILYQWNAKSYTSAQDALNRQEQSVRMEFQTRYNNVMLQLNERGLNCSLLPGCSGARPKEAAISSTRACLHVFAFRDS